MVFTDLPMDGKVDGNFHLGHLVLNCFKRRRPDDICQIEAETGQKETYGSVLSRSTRLARCLKRAGIQPGDVITVGGRNHLDLRIPFYAAVFNGLPVAGVDPLFKYDEIKDLLRIAQPKICFCDHDTYKEYERAANYLEIDVKIVTFHKGECTLSKFMDIYDGDEPEEFKPAHFDTDKVFVWLISTSGTTGVPKLAAFKHGPVIKMLKKYVEFGILGSFIDGDQKIGLNLSPPQWFSGYFNAYGFPLTNTCILQTTKMDSLDHIIDIINKYKPSVAISSPSLFTRILKQEKPCDLTCFDMIVVGGAKVYTELLNNLKSCMRPDTVIREMYGQTEGAAAILGYAPSIGAGSLSAVDCMREIKLVDVETGKEITEPNQRGELWFRGLCLEEYYNNPSETKKVFTDDGWIKTGDVFVKDEIEQYYYLERIKMMIKYRNTDIVPLQLEEAILIHPGVLEVAVTGIPHAEDSEHPVACVVRRNGFDVTAQEIKDLVAEKLSDNKKLRGGVVFLEELPKTSTGKVARMKLKKFVLDAQRE